ncbi:MAG: hypothetical protein PHP82_01210 [Candidatus ainarchaeum sp.]|nr:hypothetical protein [Candidatus ainarchaeum sp.]
MKARFEIRSIKAQWKPPFKKEITDEVFDVKEEEKFDKIVGNGNNEYVFKLISINQNIAKVEYSKLFTLKTGNPGNYIINLVKDQTIDMTYLWGEDGVTKKITYRGIVEFANEKLEQTNNEQEIKEKEQIENFENKEENN